MGWLIVAFKEYCKTINNIIAISDNSRWKRKQINGSIWIRSILRRLTIQFCTHTHYILISFLIVKCSTALHFIHQEWPLMRFEHRFECAPNEYWIVEHQKTVSFLFVFLLACCNMVWFSALLPVEQKMQQQQSFDVDVLIRFPVIMHAQNASRLCKRSFLNRLHSWVFSEYDARALIHFDQVEQLVVCMIFYFDERLSIPLLPFVFVVSLKLQI